MPPRSYRILLRVLVVLAAPIITHCEASTGAPPSDHQNAFFLPTALVVAHGGHDAEQERFNAVLNRSTAQRLVVVNAFGRVSAARVIVHNLATHFADGSAWERVVFAYTDGEVLRDALDADTRLRASGGGCTVFEVRGRYWGEFLSYLRADAVSRFEHIFLLLDDLLMPGAGPLRVSMPRLLHSMRAVGASLISPAIEGSQWRFTAMRDLTANRCIRRVHTIELFATLFEQRAWACLASMLNRSLVGGCGYVACFPKICPSYRAAIDDTAVAYHLEQAWPSEQALKRMSDPERELVQALHSGKQLRGKGPVGSPLRSDGARSQNTKKIRGKTINVIGKTRVNPCFQKGLPTGADLWRKLNCTRAPDLLSAHAIPQDADATSMPPRHHRSTEHGTVARKLVRAAT